MNDYCMINVEIRVWTSFHAFKKQKLINGHACVYNVDWYPLPVAFVPPFKLLPRSAACCKSCQKAQP